MKVEPAAMCHIVPKPVCGAAEVVHRSGKGLLETKKPFTVVVAQYLPEESACLRWGAAKMVQNSPLLLAVLCAGAVHPPDGGPVQLRLTPG